jgi:hypothetical protein
MDLARILQRQYLAPALSKLLDAGISAGLTALGIGGGGGVHTAGAGLAAASVTGTSGVASIPQMAAGGPVMPGRFYEWQERGREYFLSGNPGQVIPEHKMERGPTTINMVVHAQDAGSFKRSSGEIEARMLSALQQAQRNA